MLGCHLNHAAPFHVPGKHNSSLKSWNGQKESKDSQFPPIPLYKAHPSAIIFKWSIDSISINTFKF